MAIVFGLVDPLEERRKKAMGIVAARLASLPGLVNQKWEHGSLAILTATGPATPIDQAATAEGWAWVIGHLYPAGEQSAAECVIGRMACGAPAGINGLNGYYLACAVEPSGALTLGTDVLGFFPLYYWADREVIAFATLPGLIRAHPRCETALSLEGLAGILLQGHLANGQTIWEGIRRPDPGQAVRWIAGAGASLPRANPLLPTEAHFGLGYEAARQLINGTLHRAVGRATRPHPGGVGLMLSGGLDSRLVAAHVPAAGPALTTAFTFGDPSDLEVQCALRVAGQLKMRAVRIPIPLEAFDRSAVRCVAQEHLSNTFWDFGWVSGAAALGDGGRPLLSGFHGDPIMGGSAIPWAFDPQRGEYTFDALFSKINAFGFKAEEIAGMAALAHMDKIVHEVKEKLRACYEALPGLPFQKSWLWGLYHRNRYHVMPYAWRLSQTAWPLMPYADREMLEVAAGMPLDYLNHRRMQIDTLKQEFAGLARLPLDRNTLDTRPLLSSRSYAFKSRILAPFSRLLTGQREPRSYYRLFDINNRGWQAVRALAERHRPAAHQLIRPEALARWVPPPAEAVAAQNEILDTAKRKTLLGLMIFAGQELPARHDPAAY